MYSIDWWRSALYPLAEIEKFAKWMFTQNNAHKYVSFDFISNTIDQEIFLIWIELAWIVGTVFSKFKQISLL